MGCLILLISVCWACIAILYGFWVPRSGQRDSKHRSCATDRLINTLNSQPSPSLFRVLCIQTLPVKLRWLKTDGHSILMSADGAINILSHSEKWSDIVMQWSSGWHYYYTVRWSTKLIVLFELIGMNIHSLRCQVGVLCVTSSQLIIMGKKVQYIVEEAEFYSSKHNSVGIVWKTTCTGCKILLVD